MLQIKLSKKFQLFLLLFTNLKYLLYFSQQWTSELYPSINQSMYISKNMIHSFNYLLCIKMIYFQVSHSQRPSTWLTQFSCCHCWVKLVAPGYMTMLHHNVGLLCYKKKDNGWLGLKSSGYKYTLHYLELIELVCLLKCVNFNIG